MLSSFDKQWEAFEDQVGKIHVYSCSESGLEIVAPSTKLQYMAIIHNNTCISIPHPLLFPLKYKADLVSKKVMFTLVIFTLRKLLETTVQLHQVFICDPAFIQNNFVVFHSNYTYEAVHNFRQ